MPQDVLTYAQLCSEILNKPCNSGNSGTSGSWGKQWQVVMGSAMDAQMDRLIEAAHVGWPGYTPVDALYYLASERGLERVVLVGSGGVLEAEGDHRARLKDAWNVWKLSGSAQGHRDELATMDLKNARVVRRKEFSTPPAVGTEYVRDFARLVWSQFDVVVQKPFNVEPLRWGSGWLWGDGSTWGTTLTTAEINQIRRVVRDHKSAHNTATYLHFVFAQGAVWGLFRFGDGTRYGGSGDGTATIVIGEKWWEIRGLM